MKTKSVQDVTEQPKRVARGSLRRMVRRKLTPKQRVMAKYPDASVWWPSLAYVLVNIKGCVRFIGRGSTPALAWKDALNTKLSDPA